MAKGILIVETYPGTAVSVDEYHKWYTETHLPEIVGLPGFVAARRFEPNGEDGPFVAVYDVDVDDIDEARQTLSSAVDQGKLSLPDGILGSDPGPTVRWMQEIAAYAP